VVYPKKQKGNFPENGYGNVKMVILLIPFLPLCNMPRSFTIKENRMRNMITALLLAGLMLSSCNNASPQDYFGQAVLNCNLLSGFAGYELKRDMATPPEKLVNEKTLATEPMKRAELVKDKLKTVEANFEKVKSLSVTDDTKEMLAASTALYQYVLPVYKNEYSQLAALYDSGAEAGKIEAMEKSIIEKYEAKFSELYNAVWATGKAYATRHGIKVIDVNPSPAH
jgi:hypothetical protein